MIQVTIWTLFSLDACDSSLEAWTAEICEKYELHFWKYFKSAIHF